MSGIHPSAKDGPIPDHVIDTLARCLLPKIQTYYESEEGQKAFAEWKREQDQKKET